MNSIRDIFGTKSAKRPALRIPVPQPVAWGLLTLLIFGIFYVQLVSAPGRVAAPVQCVIEDGSGAGDIGIALKECGVVKYARVFSVYARLSGKADQLQAGTYELEPTLTVSELIRELASGNVLSTDRVVTIPEGMNMWELDVLLSDEGLSERGEIIAAHLGDEGRFFPDTYRIEESATAVDLVTKMKNTFFVRSEGFTNEQIIVASMLEKEAKTADDMALVAGIMFRRLEIGMALQIDATVGYGWCIRTAGATRLCDVTQAPIATEIGVDGPYNTYARQGLPAGPISNPGSKALEAAANPKESDYLFYLSTRDGSQIIFSKTADEHLRNRLKHLGF